MWGGTAHHRDHEGGARQTRAFCLNVLGLRLGIFGGESGGDRIAGGQPGRVLEYNEPPGHELAVIGNARCNRE